MSEESVVSLVKYGELLLGFHNVLARGLVKLDLYQAGPGSWPRLVLGLWCATGHGTPSPA